MKLVFVIELILFSKRLGEDETSLDNAEAWLIKGGWINEVLLHMCTDYILI